MHNSPDPANKSPAPAPLCPSYLHPDCRACREDKGTRWCKGAGAHCTACACALNFLDTKPSVPAAAHGSRGYINPCQTLHLPMLILHRLLSPSSFPSSSVNPQVNVLVTAFIPRNREAHAGTEAPLWSPPPHTPHPRSMFYPPPSAAAAVRPRQALRHTAQPWEHWHWQQRWRRGGLLLRNWG